MNVPTNNENAENGPLKMNSRIGPDWVEITMPLETVSEANGGKKIIRKIVHPVTKKIVSTARPEHWTDARKRHKKQKGNVALLLRPLRQHLSLPCHITFTRYAPHKLDRLDNLPMAFKWILDGCCEIITGDYRPGRADGTDEIDATFKQIISPYYGVKIVIKMLPKLVCD